MQKRKPHLSKLFKYICLIIMLIISCQFYARYNFNDYIKAEYRFGASKFERDSHIKYDSKDGKKVPNSYKIENIDYTDAMFYKTVQVTPNTPYKIKCMIKTKDVITEKSNSDAGAHIAINNTTQKSENVVGTTDWTEVEFLFNSKNETSLQIGFRLGGYEDNCRGTAWFSNFVMEAGVQEQTNNWNFLCLLFDEVDMPIEQDETKQIFKFELTKKDREMMMNNMRRFKKSLKELSRDKITATYDMFEIKEPITTVSYDEENGYYISPMDVKETIDYYIEKGIYDHIFIVFKTEDKELEKLNITSDWIGLGGMEYRNLGFSNIRLPGEQTTYIYQYNERNNTFPEEVFLHEFLHTLERNAQSYGYEIPELHSYDNYKYQNKRLTGLKDWYKDYMNKEIMSTVGDIGLPEEIFSRKPVRPEHFENSNDLQYFEEPQNLIEEIQNIARKIEQLWIQTKNKIGGHS